ncbi:hypothetical protein [Streptomyces sp. Y7]|uniref:hypothetical protein n=1 Tax=Streptomyces sp. Y7 TaxID=3342392 RepID=UPI003722644A
MESGEGLVHQTPGGLVDAVVAHRAETRFCGFVRQLGQAVEKAARHDFISTPRRGRRKKPAGASSWHLATRQQGLGNPSHKLRFGPVGA